MTETPETKLPGSEPPETGPRHAQPPESKPNGWRMSEDEREEEQLYTDRAEARERWEREQYGWALFAVTMLVLAGGFEIVNGLIALFRSGTYLVGSNGLVVSIDYTTWGWIHIGLGLLAVIAGLGLVRGAMWARILGVTLAVISAIVYMAYIPAFPAFCLVVIAVNILVVYAITVHGGELKNAEY